MIRLYNEPKYNYIIAYSVLWLVSTVSSNVASSTPINSRLNVVVQFLTLLGWPEMAVGLPKGCRCPELSAHQIFFAVLLSEQPQNGSTDSVSKLILHVFLFLPHLLILFFISDEQQRKSQSWIDLPLFCVRWQCDLERSLVQCCTCSKLVHLRCSSLLGI